MNRPDSKDVFAPKPGIFEWLRDQAYNFVYYEIGAGLDFVGDLIRGPSGYTQSLHRQTEKAQRRMPQEKPLSKDEQAIFAFMLQRKPGEDQVAYWKRKKAMLNLPDKHSLVKQHQAEAEKYAKQQSGSSQIILDTPARSRGITRSDVAKHTKPRSRR